MADILNQSSYPQPVVAVDEGRSNSKAWLLFRMSGQSIGLFDGLRDYSTDGVPTKEPDRTPCPA